MCILRSLWSKQIILGRHSTLVVDVTSPNECQIYTQTYPTHFTEQNSINRLRSDVRSPPPWALDDHLRRSSAHSSPSSCLEQAGSKLPGYHCNGRLWGHHPGEDHFLFTNLCFTFFLKFILFCFLAGCRHCIWNQFCLWASFKSAE